MLLDVGAELAALLLGEHGSLALVGDAELVDALCAVLGRVVWAGQHGKQRLTNS